MVTLPSSWVQKEHDVDFMLKAFRCCGSEQHSISRKVNVLRACSCSVPRQYSQELNTIAIPLLFLDSLSVETVLSDLVI